MYKLVVTIAALFTGLIIWVIYTANTGGHSVFIDFVRSLPHGDKLGHFFLFGILTFIIIMATKFRAFPISTFTVYYGVALVSAFVLFEEISQFFLPNRDFDLLDLLADATGILLFAWIAWSLNKLLLKNASQLSDNR